MTATAPSRKTKRNATRPSRPAEQAAPPAPPARSPRSTARQRVAVGVALLLYVVMAMHGVAQKSGTYDEFVHVTAGFSYWAFDDYRLNPENGNWSQRLVALPAVLSDAAFPSREQDAWNRADMWELSDQFFFGPGRDADALLWRSRLVVALAGAALGLLVFAWSRSLFGLAGAWVTLIVYVFSPTMLAHGALATSDVLGALFFTAATWSLWRALHRTTPSSVALSCLSMGGLFLTKPSALIFAAVAMALAVVRIAGRRPLTVRLGGTERAVDSRLGRARWIAGVAALHVVAVFVLVWMSYGFRYSAFAAGGPGAQFFDPWSELLSDPAVPSSLVEWGRAVHILPEAYLYGLTTVMAYAHRASFLNGQVVVGGSPWFFPYAFAVKTTIPALLLLLALPAALVARRRGTASASETSEDAGFLPYDLIPVVVLVCLYGASALASTLDIGHRHLLPIIPAGMVMLGACAYPLSAIGGRVGDSERASIGGWWIRARARSRSIRIAAALLVVALTWHAVESLRTAPDYLAYFNPLDGGPAKAYRHLVDSSLDWGQDLPGLKRWLDREGLQGTSHAPVYLSYFGTARPEHYGIDARPLPGFPDHWTPRVPVPLEPGVYAISATMAQSVYLIATGAWTRQYETDYQSMLYNLRLFDSTAANPAARAALLRQTGEQYWVDRFRVFEHLRFARLMAWLRTREPDAQVGHSILIYRVDAPELSRAMDGPSPEVAGR